MAWETPRSWWSQGYTAPLGVCAPEAADKGAFYVFCDGQANFWEVRVGSDGTAYTYCLETGDMLHTRELPRSRPPKGGRE